MDGSVDKTSDKSSTRSKPTPLPERKKLTPRTTAKRLPWLDDKALRAVASTSLDGGNTDSPSPGTAPTSRRVSVATASKPTTTTTKTTVRRVKVLPATERRIPSAAASSPSPVTRHKQSQARRASFAPNTVSPLRSARHVSISQSHEPQRRLSVVHHDHIDEEFGDSPLYDTTRPRVNSIAPVPDHLEMSSTSEEIRIPIQRDVEYVSTSPAVISRVHMSPTQPVPTRTVFERVSNRRISNAVEGLEDMVQDAVGMAEVTHDRGQIEEIHDIIEEARDAIHDVSNPDHLMTTALPLRLSSSSSSSDFITPPTAAGIRNVPDDVAPHVVPLPPGQQRASVSYDWAYTNRSNPRHGKAAVSSSSSSSSSDREISRDDLGTRSDLLLPKLVQAAPRETVDFVLRPVGHRDESRGRSRRRITGNTPPVHTHRHRHRHHRSPEHVSVPRPEPRDSGFEESFDDDDDDDDDEKDVVSAKPYGTELTMREQAHHHTFNLRRHHKRQPIARNWSTGKKRWTATIACINTALLGIIIGIYAGEVPRIQYYLADERHIVIIGNAVLYAGLAISTFFAWTLPLLHGRKPYILAALALAMPLQFPQAIMVTGYRSNDAKFRVGLLLSRAVSGLVLGFANVNYITVLLDLFGASLQSKNPHQEFVVVNDVRRHGGGMGIWLGIWSWCWIASLAVGFMIGAAIIEDLTPDWGFYIVVLIIIGAMLLNILAPETRRAPYRKSVTEVYDRDENYITRRVSRGEVKLHIATEGPKYWFEEVWAGIKLQFMMLLQPGFFILCLYLGWIYAQIVLVIVLLGALLSRDYRWSPTKVGAGVTSIAIGAALAIPLTKARIFSRERKRSFRTDSMTFQKQVSWSSHLVRRAIFTLLLPLMGIAYTVSSAGRPKPWLVPVVFAGCVGFLSVLAIAECHGLIMETFDTCDLQPGVNTRHRLQSMAVQDRRRRTNYTSFPRVTAGIFASQIFAFVLAAVATLVGGNMTRRLGAQTSTGVTAGILFGLTVLLILILLRFKSVQVVPNHTFGTRRDTAAWNEFKDLEKLGRGSDWKAVVIGNPSGKMRRMSVLELGALSRWTEIRKLNFLIKGEMLGYKKKKKERGVDQGS